MSAPRAIEAGLAALPGTSLISVSNPPDAQGAYLVRVRFPKDRTPVGRSRVLVDQYSAEPILVSSSRTAPLAARSAILNRAIHTGDIFGYPTKIVVSLSCLLLVLQTLTEYYLWWKKLRF